MDEPSRKSESKDRDLWMDGFSKKMQKKVELMDSAESFRTVLMCASEKPTQAFSSSARTKNAWSRYGILGKFDFEQSTEALTSGGDSSLHDSTSIANISDSSSMSDWSVIVTENPGEEKDKQVV